MSGGSVDLSVSIKSPSGVYLANVYRQSEFNEQFDLEEEGIHEICFDNSFSVVTDKVVYFDLGIEDAEHKPEIEYFADLNLVRDEYDNTTFNSVLVSDCLYSYPNTPHIF